jgi:hypothetical protein
MPQECEHKHSLSDIGHLSPISVAQVWHHVGLLPPTEGRRMIIGSGLIARAFAVKRPFLGATCLYAAGVSNSSCSDSSEFARERARLSEVLGHTPPAVRFVYFSTCSIEDPWSTESLYVAHKVAMESLVRRHDNHLIVRLPQVAGRTANPHTLLNYLYARICRSECFELWRGAYRNIVDIDHVADILTDLITTEDARGETLNIANPRNCSISDIVASFERVTSRNARYHAVDRGGEFAIDVARVAGAIRRCAIDFEDDYLLKILAKYYA